jgi:predicted NUDIX family NTP pyrophosphohydrolase
VRGDIDQTAIRSNTFSIELPKGSGRMREFPEVDRADWFSLDEARRKILKGQVALLDQFERKIPDGR